MLLKKIIVKIIFLIGLSSLAFGSSSLTDVNDTNFSAIVYEMVSVEYSSSGNATANIAGDSIIIGEDNVSSTGPEIGDRIDFNLSYGATFADGNYSLEQWLGGAGTGNIGITKLITTDVNGSNKITFEVNNSNWGGGSSLYKAILGSSRYEGSNFIGAGQAVKFNLPFAYAGTVIYLQTTYTEYSGGSSSERATATVKLFEYQNQFSASISKQASGTIDHLNGVTQFTTSDTNETNDSIIINFSQANITNRLTLNSSDKVEITLTGNMIGIDEINISRDGTSLGTFTINTITNTAFWSGEANHTITTTGDNLALIEMKIGSQVVDKRSFTLKADLNFYDEIDKNLIASGTSAGSWGSNNNLPIASSVTISGTTMVGQTLTGSYSYSDTDNHAESDSTYQWYRADSVAGDNAVVISSATSKNYTLTSSDTNKYISFGVKPKDTIIFGIGNEVNSSYTLAIEAQPTVQTNVVFPISGFDGDITIPESIEAIELSDGTNQFSIENLNGSTVINIPPKSSEVKEIDITINSSGVETKITAPKDAKFSLQNDGSITQSMTIENTKVEVSANSNGKVEIKKETNSEQKVISLPEGANINVASDSSVLGEQEIVADVANSEKPMKIKAEAKLNKELKITAIVENRAYSLTTREESFEANVELMEKNSNQRTNKIVYSGIKSTFSSRKRFALSKTNSRGTIEGNSIEIFPTTQWQKFEEKQYFDGRRTITLLMGGANLIIDGEVSKMEQNVEYFIGEFVEEAEASTTDETTNENSTTSSSFSLELFKGWNLISNPIETPIPKETYFNIEIIYTYEDEWYTSDTLKASKGYWVKVSKDLNISFNSKGYTSNYSAVDNWSLLGAGKDINLTNLNQFSKVLIFNSKEKTWIKNYTTIKRGYGFWAK